MKRVRRGLKKEDGVNAKSVSQQDIEIGKLVRTRRLDLKMSQTDLGEALGVTFQQIQKYEKGANRIGAGRLMEVAKALNVSVAYFYPQPAKGQEEKEGQSLLTELLSARLNLRLLRAFVRIEDRAVQEQFVGLVEKAASAMEKGGRS